jgi:hypothetical protein
MSAAAEIAGFLEFLDANVHPADCICGGHGVCMECGGTGVCNHCSPLTAAQRKAAYDLMVSQGIAVGPEFMRPLPLTSECGMCGRTGNCMDCGGTADCPGLPTIN